MTDMTDTSEVDTIEIRCAESPWRMFAKLLREADDDVSVVSGNLLEFACRDCTKRERERGSTGYVERVLHRFNILGDLIESEIVVNTDAVIAGKMADNEDSG